MRKPVEPDYFSLSQLSPDAAASSGHTIQLGPPQRVKVLTRLPFFAGVRLWSYRNRSNPCGLPRIGDEQQMARATQEPIRRQGVPGAA